MKRINIIICMLFVLFLAKETMGDVAPVKIVTPKLKMTGIRWFDPPMKITTPKLKMTGVGWNPPMKSTTPEEKVTEVDQEKKGAQVSFEKPIMTESFVMTGTRSDFEEDYSPQSQDEKEQKFRSSDSLQEDIFEDEIDEVEERPVRQPGARR